MPRGKKTKKADDEVKEIIDGVKEIVDETIEVVQEIVDEVKEVALTEHEKKLEDLLKEVEIFSTEGDFEMKSNWLGTTLIVLVVVALFGLGVFFFLNRYSSEDEGKLEDTPEISEYRYSVEEDRIEFLKSNEVINTYSCESECGVYKENDHGLFSQKPTVIVLYDGVDVFLYDYVKGDVISDNYVRMQNLIIDDETIAFIVHGSNNVGVIGLNGKIKVPMEYLNLGFSIDYGDVSDFSRSRITAQTEEGWGLISLQGNNVVIPFEHNDIFYNGQNRVVIYENNLWYLLDLEGNEVLSDGYDMIVPIGSRVFASRESNFYILNSRGNPIISSDIPTFVSAFRSRISNISPAFELNVEGSMINIVITNPNGTNPEYQFNTVNGVLTEVIR